MAGGLESISPIAPQSPVERVTTYQKQATDNVQKPGSIAEVSETTSTEKEEDSSKLEDVVAVSEDGDTVQVSEEGKDQLVQGQFPEGTVRVNPSRNRKKELLSEEAGAPKSGNESYNRMEDEGLRKEDGEENFSTDITSYAGYTDARLEQMYLKGDISQYDYEHEMDRRERLEQNKETEQEALNDKLGNSDREMKSADRTQEAIQVAFSDQASQTTDPKLRMEMMERLDRLGQEDQVDNQRSDEQNFQVSIG